MLKHVLLESRSRFCLVCCQRINMKTENFFVYGFFSVLDKNGGGEFNGEYLMEMRAYLFRVVNSDCFPYLSIVKKFTNFILDCSSVSFISSDSTFILLLFPHQVKLRGIKIIIVLHILSYHFPTSEKKIRKSADVASYEYIIVTNLNRAEHLRHLRGKFFSFSIHFGTFCTILIYNSKVPEI